jgi:transcriptional regulator with PAS, ATPase and Fis domain
VRNHKPFVCLNCAAIPDTLLESELFGYERGAFTGALAVQKGKFELAHGGTLFLDEIGEMGPMAQAKILRAIETKQIYRLGGQVGHRLDVRFLAATNQPLKQLMQADKFRTDLFYRLSVTTIHLPPLRDRRVDIPALVDYFIQQFNERWGRDVIGVTPDALTALVGYAWPGNVREVKNVLERLFVDPNLHEIDYGGLPDEIRMGAIGITKTNGEAERIMAALHQTQWNKSRAAQELQWSRMTLYRKLIKYQIKRMHDMPAGF